MHVQVNLPEAKNYCTSKCLLYIVQIVHKDCKLKKAQICMHSSPKRLRSTFFLLKWYYFLVRDKLYNLNIWVVIEEKCIIPCIDQANKAHVSTEQVQRLSYIS